MLIVFFRFLEELIFSSNPFLIVHSIVLSSIGSDHLHFIEHMMTRDRETNVLSQEINQITRMVSERSIMIFS